MKFLFCHWLINSCPSFLGSLFITKWFLYKKEFNLSQLAFTSCLPHSQLPQPKPQKYNYNIEWQGFTRQFSSGSEFVVCDVGAVWGLGSCGRAGSLPFPSSSAAGALPGVQPCPSLPGVTHPWLLPFCCMCHMNLTSSYHRNENGHRVLTCSWIKEHVNAVVKLQTLMKLKISQIASLKLLC